MEHTMIVQREPEPLALARIGERFRHLRIVDPAAERAITTSMHRFGQLTPVVVCRLEPGQFQLLDGFKRLSAARSLAMQELSACRLEASLRAGKAAMLHLNRAGRMISGMEEALVVHSLCHEDGLSQVEIAELLGFLHEHKVRNHLWLTADVHYCAAHHYHPDGAAFQDFEPFWEFVAGPLNAGSFGPNPLDKTFGPQVVFQKAPPAQNTSPFAGFQFFGEVQIDGQTAELTVMLRDLDGVSVFEQKLQPA